MKNFFLFLFLLASIGIYAQKPEIIHVTTHKRATIVTDPARGEKEYPAWGVFPGKDVSVRRILMHVTLGCPDSLPCAHWDYLDHITLRRAGGKNAKSLDYELGRMLTPYGSIFTPKWNWTWTVDVTDFAIVLRDSVEIEYMHSGYETPTVGWALTLDFEIVKGPEIIHPISLTKMWEGSFRYGDPAEDIEKKLAPINFQTAAGANLSRFRIQHTGHGMDEPRGCSEFCSRWRDITFDGKLVDHTNLWKNCGDNPLYPQGGTWIYDRAWWCPGNLQPADIVDVFPSKGTHTFDLTMEPYTATANIQANESIASYLIQYSGPLAGKDAAIESIMVPNNDQNYSRMNPAGFNPVIVIRNLGKENLKSTIISYGTEGFATKTFAWKGDLAFNKTAVIVLPGDIDHKPGLNTFSVHIGKLNGKKDAWEGDNKLSSTFLPPPVLPQKMVLQLLTNNKPSENEIKVVDSKGNIVFNKKSVDLKPKTMYYDTLTFDPGTYALLLSDSAGDGLEFWYEVESGYGYMRLLSPDGRLIHDFESDCGDGHFYAFTASQEASVDTNTTQYAFILYPRRTSGNFNLDVHADKAGSMEVKITADGVLVQQHYYKTVKQNRFTYDVGYLPKGRYIIEVLIDGESKFKRRFNKD